MKEYYSKEAKGNKKRRIPHLLLKKYNGRGGEEGLSYKLSVCIVYTHLACVLPGTYDLTC